MANKLPGGLYAVIDDGLAHASSLEMRCAAAIAGGAAVVQLRLKQTKDREALALIRRVVAAAGTVPVIVNDRVDLALGGGASGVHLGSEDLPVAAARSVLGPAAIIGFTARSALDAARGMRAGADYVGVGPIFVTRTKPMPMLPLGTAALEAVCRASSLPVVAIGGICEANIGCIFASGAWGAAVAGGLLAGESIQLSARRLAARFQGSRR